MSKHQRYRRKNSVMNALIWIIILILIIIIAIGWHTNDKREKTEEIYYQSLRAEQQAQRRRNTELLEKGVDEIKLSLPGIVCWGDNLTAGAGAGGEGVTYPKVLQSQIKSSLIDNLTLTKYLISNPMLNISLPDVPVVNMGVGGENTITILGRNGAIPFVTSEEFTIPTTSSPTEVVFESASGAKVAPLLQGKRGMESVTILGVQGIIEYTEENETTAGKYNFSRLTSGNSTIVPRRTEIITIGSKQYLDYLPVVFIGQNGGYVDIHDLISQQRAIIDKQSVNNDRFIIIGLHTGTAVDRKTLEDAMTTEYGDKYINLREYMCSQGIKDANDVLGANIAVTAEDKSMMENGETPASLLSDAVHFDKYGYELIGRLIYNRMDELGYFNAVKNSGEVQFDIGVLE